MVWFLCLMAYQLFLGYLMPKAFSEKNRIGYYLTRSWKDKGVHTFPKGICPKVNVIARLEYELAYYDSAVHRFNHYATRTPHLVGRVFVIGSGDLGSIPGRVIPKVLKWFMIPPCLTLSNIRYVLRAKWSNPGKRVAPPLHLGVVAIEEKAFWSPSTTTTTTFKKQKFKDVNYKERLVSFYAMS